MASPSFATAVHSDIIKTHILARLDGATLASFSCVCSRLNSLINSDETLWTDICHSTWPSTNTPRLRHVISSFPANGPRSFFYDSFTNPDNVVNDNNTDCLPSELISAVDIHYRNKHIFSKVTNIKPFNFSQPFRVDSLVPTGIAHPANDDMCRDLEEGLTFSWIIIDPVGRRAMNLSSYKAVTVRRRWLSSSEVHVRYAWVFTAGKAGSSTEHVKCGISVTCEESDESGEMQLSKMILQLEDRYGKQLSGKDGLVIIHRGLRGKRGKVKGREVEAKRRYEGFMEMRMKRERTQQTQRRLDTLGFREAFRLLIFVSLGFICFQQIRLLV